MGTQFNPQQWAKAWKGMELRGRTLCHLPPHDPPPLHTFPPGGSLVDTPAWHVPTSRLPLPQFPCCSFSFSVGRPTSSEALLTLTWLFSDLLRLSQSAAFFRLQHCVRVGIFLSVPFSLLPAPCRAQDQGARGRESSPPAIAPLLRRLLTVPTCAQNGEGKAIVHQWPCGRASLGWPTLQLSGAPWKF